MTNRLWATAIERAGTLTAPLALDELPDTELLRRFVTAREECSFAAIVRRHGPLVWGVCRNLLTAEADAEDAFQATFLVLVRSAHQIRQATALGAWLHRVAGRVCRNSLRGAARRRKYERSAAVDEATRPVDAATWDRWHSAVHEEIDRLPDSLRVPFVLCVLQGVRQTDAARRLGWKLGTVSARVCKAKQALAEAVSRRGLAAAAVLTAAVGSSAPISAGLVARAKLVIPSGGRPGGEVSSTVHELARGAMGGLMTKTKLLAAAVVVGTLAIGVGTSVLSSADAQGVPPGGGGGGPPPGVGLPGGAGGGGGLPPGFGPPGPGGGPGGLAGPGAPPPGMSGGGATGMMGSGSASRGPRIEYQFLARPRGSAAFKNLITQQGGDGWEYVGQVPGDDELIFKRLPRPVSGGGVGGVMGPGGGMGMPGMGGFMPGGAGAGAGPGIGGPPMGGMNPFGGGMSGFGGGPGGYGGPKGPGAGTGAAPKTGAAGMGEGGGGAAAGGPKGNPVTISLRVGETIRHKMSTQQQIDRVFSHDVRVADANPDPTDSKRVLIKGVAGGGVRLELTDANGAKEEYMIRVR